MIRQKDYLMHFGTKGMKWGVRRYQSKDGKLTDAGRKRYARDAREKNFDKYDAQSEEYYAIRKGNKKDTLKADPNRYVKEDMERTKRAMDTSASAARTMSEANRRSARKHSQRNRLDLSEMSDKELRDQINRELLERQYNDVFNPAKESKGRKYISDVLDTTGTLLTIGSSALGIALAIRELRGR